MKGSITIKLEGSNLYECDLKKIAKQAALDAMRIEGVYCTSFHWDTGEDDVSDDVKRTREAIKKYKRSPVDTTTMDSPNRTKDFIPPLISEGAITTAKIEPYAVVAKTDYRCPCLICSCKK